MHEFWTVPTSNMAYIRSQTYTNMVAGKHGRQTFEIVVVVLLFDILSPQVHISYCCWTSGLSKYT